MDQKEDTVHKITHKLRNLFGPVQVFLDIVDANHSDPKLQSLHQNCRKNLQEVHQLLLLLERDR
ncbi:MAG: hypothetical protein Q7S68_04270 [Deltaproteobacteria bacterium]|nr:hypothetical protein [Deltaproteobacteria bacterium]